MNTKLEDLTAETTPISEVMTKDPICVSINRDVGEVADLILQRSIGGVPVVDTHGKAIGVISKTDLVRERRRWTDGDVSRGGRRRPDVVAGDLMSATALTLPPDASIARAASLMVHEGLHRVPVVASNGEVIGLISSIDVLRWIAEKEGYISPRRELRRSAVED